MAGMSMTDAVNLCLRGVGLEEVAGIEEDADVDAASAFNTVMLQSSIVQSKGWWFNKEYDWKLTPDTVGNISVPSAAASVITSGDSYYSNNLVIRGNKLYNTIKHTYNMTDALDGNGEITVSFMLILDWDDLPAIAKTYIAYRARRQFSTDFELEELRIKAHAAEEQEVKDMFYAEDALNKKTNVFTGSSSNSVKMAMIGGPNSRRLFNV